nr:unnamed protein product [Spirometra erinaceieuropaei]
MWVVFRQCATSPAEITAVTMGMISVIAWMLNGIPQIIENYRKGIPDQAVSLFLLIFWAIGDSLSFAGGVLTHQLVLQVVVAFYSIVNDTILLGQYFFYRSRHKQLLEAIPNDMETLLPSDSANDAESPPTNYTQDVRRGSTASLLSITALLCVGLPCVSRTHAPLVTKFSLEKSRILGQSTTPSSHSPFYPTPLAYAGYILGWFSSLMYLSSRFPQILQNWRRASTEGLSIFVFMFALIGNASYGLQIFLTSTDALFLLHSLPWILGSLGVLLLDLVILFQFYVFRRRQQSNLIRTTEAESTAV